MLTANNKVLAIATAVRLLTEVPFELMPKAVTIEALRRVLNGDETMFKLMADWEEVASKHQPAPDHILREIRRMIEREPDAHG